MIVQLFWKEDALCASVHKNKHVHQWACWHLLYAYESSKYFFFLFMKERHLCVICDYLYVWNSFLYCIYLCISLYE